MMELGGPINEGIPNCIHVYYDGGVLKHPREHLICEEGSNCEL